MRKSELLNLQWEDVDFKRGILKISSTEKWHTKNYESRTMPLHEEARTILERIRKETGYVFRPQDRVRENTFYYRVTRELAKAVKSAVLDHLTLHTLRHTFASHLVMAGVDLPTVQRLLGYKDIKTTMRYAHLAPEHLRMSTAMLDFGGHYVDTRSLGSKISPNQNCHNSLKKRGFKGES